VQPPQAVLDALRPTEADVEAPRAAALQALLDQRHWELSGRATGKPGWVHLKRWALLFVRHVPKLRGLVLRDRALTEERKRSP
jgi:hypothetical protein